jgi:hypothetical protein
MGMNPPMTGGLGTQPERERQRADYLVEDDEFWRADADVLPPVIGAGE